MTRFDAFLRWGRRCLKRWAARVGGTVLSWMVLSRSSAQAGFLGGLVEAPDPFDPVHLRCWIESLGTSARILLIRVDERVGNVLLTTPLLSALSAAFPLAQIDVLLARSKHTLVEGLANVRVFEKRDVFRRPGSFVGCLYALRRRQYHVAIDASHWHQFSLTHALLLGWTRALVRIAHDRGDADRFATHLVGPRGEAGDPPMGEIARKLELLGPLGTLGDPTSMTTSLGRLDADQREAERVLQDLGLSGARIVGLMPGSRKLDHRAPFAVFEALVGVIHELGACPLILWGPGEADLAASLAARSGAVLAPATDLRRLAAIVRRLAATVANDTGTMHLSVACNTPTLALFVGGDPARWGHVFARHEVIAADGRSDEAVVDEARAALLRMLRP
ncbi:MAG: glycosyltransferase family 9 protein [Deltaproteobacteria bacterium]|nr:glycosyltransferase family 9 protein [Deltaproteobacteria bacterium]